MLINKLIASFACIFFRKSPRIRAIVGSTITFGVFNFFASKYRSDKNKEFENFLSIAAIIKNEGPYIKEWLEYHKLVGVEKFYIYDNGSTDDTYATLKPYINSGLVTYKHLPGNRQQIPAYTECIKKYQYKTKWLAIIDIDEFIVPVSHKSIPAVIADIIKDNLDISQLLVGWVVYGSNSHQAKPNGLVVENYTRCESNPLNRFWHKVILNPRKVYAVHIHACAVHGKTVAEDLSEASVLSQDTFTVSESFRIGRSKIQINHYAVKSYEEFLIKKYRGDAARTKQTKDDSYFSRYDRNEKLDKNMVKYIKYLKNETH